MNIEKLLPTPNSKDSFQRDRCKFVPEASGCYVLTTFLNEILYLGLASNLRIRMVQHLDSSSKTCETILGRAVWIHWIETSDTNKVERTWMNIHLENEGKLPIFNKVYSPTST